MFKKKYIPYSAVLELTLQCNMKCMHCGSSAGKSRKDELTTNEWINLCNELHELGCKEVTLIGGEPFLRKNWYEIAYNIKDNGMKLSIVSNGYSIDDKVIAKLTKLKPHVVGISIDGASSKTHDSIRGVKGSFEKCKHSLIMLKEAGIPTTVVTTVHKMNLKELPELRDFLLNKGIAWQIQIADATGRFPKKLHVSKKDFYSIALFIASTRSKYSNKELAVSGAHCIGYHSNVLPSVMMSPIWSGCQAGITVLGIQSNGGIKGCLSLPDAFIEGNVKEASLSHIWNDYNAFSYNRQFKKEDLNGECKECKYGKTCKGGCLAVSTSVTGKSHCNPFCLYSIEKQMEKTSS